MVRTSLEDVKITIKSDSETIWWDRFERGLENIENKATDQVEVKNIRRVVIDQTEDVSYDNVDIVCLDVDVSGFMPRDRVIEKVSEEFGTVDNICIENS